MSTSTPEPLQFPVPFRMICLFNALVWSIAHPPWSQPDAWSAFGAIAGIALWAMLGFWGNRPGWPRHATLACVAAYALYLLAQVRL